MSDSLKYILELWDTSKVVDQEGLLRRTENGKWKLDMIPAYGITEQDIDKWNSNVPWNGNLTEDYLPIFKEDIFQDSPVYVDKDGNVVVKGNLLATGEIQAWSDLGQGLPASLLDSLPIASYTQLGIASFDSTFFEVIDGHVSFIGTGGTLDHAQLSHLGFDESMHTGFQKEITRGTTSQYFDATFGLHLIPTKLSEFTNDLAFISGVTLTGDVSGTGTSSITTTVDKLKGFTIEKTLDGLTLLFHGNFATTGEIQAWTDDGEGLPASLLDSLPIASATQFGIMEVGTGLLVTDGLVSVNPDIVTKETDPVFTASPSYGITQDEIDYWNSTDITDNQSITLSGDVSGVGKTAITTLVDALQGFTIEKSTDGLTLLFHGNFATTGEVQAWSDTGEGLPASLLDSLPIASATQFGIMEVGEGLAVTAGLVSVVGGAVTAEWGKITGILTEENQPQLFTIFEQVAKKNVAQGYAGLDANGLIDPTQLPPLAISATYVVASEAGQLALSVQEGDIAVRTDLNESFIALSSTNASLSDWQQLLTPTDNYVSGISWVASTGTLTIQRNVLADLSTTLDGRYVVANTSITAATHTKITYDTKGLVIAGSDATTADIASSLNKRYVTDLQSTILGILDDFGFSTPTAGTLLFDGNLAVTKEIQAWSDDGTGLPASLLDALPIANYTTDPDAGLGIASFDSTQFAVTDGAVTLLAGAGAGMVFPAAGIALSTGGSWATSITDNSANWNTSFNWGDWSTGVTKTFVEGLGISITESQISDFGNYVPVSRKVSIYGTTSQVDVDTSTHDLTGDVSWVLSLPQSICPNCTPTFASVNTASIYNDGVITISSGSYNMIFSTTGNFSFGGENPEYKFDVVGAARFTDKLIAQNGILINTTTVRSGYILNVNGKSYFGDEVYIDGITTINNDFNVMGDGYFNGAVKIDNLSDKTIPINSTTSGLVNSPITIDANGNVKITGNLIATGEIQAWTDDGSGLPQSLLDALPVASTTALGIAEFDDSFFSVTNGKVTFIGSGGSGGTLDHAQLTNLDYASSGHTGFEPALAAGTTAQYYRGDKTWATFPTNLTDFTNDLGNYGGFVERAGDTMTGALSFDTSSTTRDINNVNRIGIPASDWMDIQLYAGASFELHRTTDSVNVFKYTEGNAYATMNQIGLTIGSETDPGATNLRVEGTITEAGTLLSAKYLGISAKAADSDLLDGIDSNYYDQRAYTKGDNYLGGYYVSGGSEKPNNGIFGHGKLKLAMLSNANLGYGSGGWIDVLWISGYTGSDVKGSYALAFDKYNDDIWFSRQDYDATDWGTGHKLWHTGNLTNVSQLTNDVAYLTSVAFSDLTSHPTTIAGYGITDFNSLGDARWLGISAKAADSDLWDSYQFADYLDQPVRTGDSPTFANLLTEPDKTLKIIPDNADLNNYVYTGFYIQESNDWATDGTNYPVALAGILKVYNDGTYMTEQQYTDYTHNRIYYRYYYNGTWSSWHTIYSTVNANNANADWDANILRANFVNPTNLNTGKLPYYNGTSLVDSPVYTDGTNVGIGTTTPYGLLELHGTGSPYSMFRITTNGGGGFTIGAADNSANPTWRLSTNSGEDFDFLINDVSELYLSNTGFVGIGYTADPTSGNKLAVNGSTYINGNISLLGKIYNGHSPTCLLTLYDHDYTVGDKTIADFRRWYNSDGDSAGLMIQSDAGGTNGIVKLLSSGTSSQNMGLGPNGTDIFISKINGFVGIGYTSDPTSGNKLAVNGNVYSSGVITSDRAGTITDYSLIIKANGVTNSIGSLNTHWLHINTTADTGVYFYQHVDVDSLNSRNNITAAGEVTAWSASDRRLKTAIQPITNARGMVRNYRPIMFQWNGLALKLNPAKDDRWNYGVIADELALYNPEFIHPLYGGKYDSVDYEQMHMITLAAVKEIDSDLENTKQETNQTIELLRKEVIELRQEINQLKG